MSSELRKETFSIEQEKCERETQVNEEKFDFVTPARLSRLNFGINEKVSRDSYVSQFKSVFLLSSRFEKDSLKIS